MMGNIQKKKFMGRLVLGLLLSFISAALFSIILHFQLWFLIWISLIPIFYFIYKDRSFLIVFFMGLTNFLISAGGFYWLGRYYNGFFFYSLLVMGLSGLLVGFFYFVTSRLTNKLNMKYLKIFLIPFCWLLVLIVFSFNQFGNSWFTFSFFYSNVAPFSSILGRYGITFLIILTNSALAYSLVYRDKKILVFGIILLLVPVFSFAYSSYLQNNVQGEVVKLALIQGNFNQSWTWRFDFHGTLLDEYEKLTLEAAENDVDFIIWPEYSVPTDLSMNKTAFDRIARLADETNVYLVMGSLTFLDKDRTSFNDSIKDTALVFSPEGKLVGKYDSVLPASFRSNVVAGDEISFFETEKGSFSIGICNEIYLGADVYDERSDFIITLSNNVYFDNTIGIDLVAQFTLLRAAENNKYVVSVSNTGLTQVIDPSGRVIDKLKPHERGILYSEIYV